MVLVEGSKATSIIDGFTASITSNPKAVPLFREVLLCLLSVYLAFLVDFVSLYGYACLKVPRSWVALRGEGGKMQASGWRALGFSVSSLCLNRQSITTYRIRYQKSMQLTQAKIYTACLVRIGGATKERGENSRDRVSFFRQAVEQGHQKLLAC